MNQPTPDKPAPSGDEADVCPACKSTRDFWKSQRIKGINYFPASGPYCNHCANTGKLSVAVARRLNGEYDADNDVPF